MSTETLEPTVGGVLIGIAAATYGWLWLRFRNNS